MENKGLEILYGFREASKGVQSLKRENEWVLLTLYFFVYYKREKLEAYYRGFQNDAFSQKEISWLNFHDKFGSYQCSAAADILSRMFKDELLDILEFFLNLNVDDSVESFRNNVLAIIESMESQLRDIFSPPQGVIEVVQDFISDKSDSVYFPYNGTIVLDPKRNFGVEYQDPSTVSSALAYYKYCALAEEDLLSMPEMIDLDPIQFWNVNDSDRVSAIVSFPPLMSSINSEEVDAELFELKDISDKVIYQGMNLLKDNGKLVIMMPYSFLFKKDSNSIAFKKYLIDNNWIDSIIQFSTGILKSSNVKVVLLVLKKGRAAETVKLINATEYTARLKKETVFDSKKFLKDFHSNSIKESVVVAKSAFIDNSYDLLVDRYIVEDQLEVDNGVLLSDLVEITSGRKPNADFGIRLSVKDLKNDALDCQLDISTIDVQKIKNLDREILGEGILMSNVGSDIKASYFNLEDGQSIFISHNIVVLRINDDMPLNYLFLVTELYADYVKKQKKAFEVGTVQQHISKKSIGNIRISVPHWGEQLLSIAAQKAKVDKIKELAKRVSNLQDERNKLAQGIEIKAKNEIASIRHTFRQYLSAASSNVSGTKKFLAKNEGQPITLDMLYSRNLNQSLGGHLDSIQDTLDAIANLLTKFGMDHTGPVFDDNDLMDMIAKCQVKLKNPEVFNFAPVTLDELSFGDESDGSVIIKMAYDDFLSLYSDIVSNAISHGFKEKGVNYKIDTHVTYDSHENMVRIDISNNGLPAPDDFTIGDLITKGEKTVTSAGDGLGGHNINYLVDIYNGKLEWTNDPVTYSIYLPLKLEEDEN